MAAIISKEVEGHGPYLYKVTHIGNGKQDWEILGRADQLDIDTGPVPDAWEHETLNDTNDAVTLTGNTQDRSVNALRWGENRPVVGEQIDEELIEKVNDGEELTSDEARRVEIALRVQAQYYQEKADNDEHSIMGGPDSMEEYADWSRAAADDIDVAGDDADAVVEAYKMQSERRDVTNRRGMYKDEELMQRASDADVSLAPEEALPGGIGETRLEDGTPIKRDDLAMRENNREAEMEQHENAVTNNQGVEDAVQQFSEETPDRRSELRQEIDAREYSQPVLNTLTDRRIYRENVNTGEETVRNVLEEHRENANSDSDAANRTKYSRKYDITYDFDDDGEDDTVPIEALEAELVDAIEDTINEEQ